MEIYIALLRGINVSGHKQIRMAALQDALTGAGLQNVRTYIQSGNVIFEKEGAGPAQLTALIKQTILSVFGFDVEVVLRTLSELEAVLRNNPFEQQDVVDTSLLYFTFLNEVPATDRIASFSAADHSPEKLVVSGKQVYLYVTNGYGNTRLSNSFIEGKLKIKATTRNWKTVSKLVELAKLP